MAVWNFGYIRYPYDVYSLTKFEAMDIRKATAAREAAALMYHFHPFYQDIFEWAEVQCQRTDCGLSPELRHDYHAKLKALCGALADPVTACMPLP